MAWELWKEVLLPGRMRDPRTGEWFGFTPRDIRRAHGNVSRMLSRGVPIPCVWEHVGVEAGDSDARKARYAKYTFAHIAGRRLNGRGALELLHRGEDDRDRDQLLKTRFVSPKVYPSYSDSRGGEYRGTTIAHVAATPTPVQFWQRPFELSRGRALYLSYSPEDRTMADDADDKGGKKGGGGAGDGAASDLSKLIDALRETGMNIPDEVVDIGGLIIAVKASGGAGGETDPDLDLDDVNPGGSGGTDGAPGGGAPMLMSDDRAEPFRKSARREAVARIRALFSSGRVDRPTAEKRIREAKAVQLSITRDGDVGPNKLFAWIEAMEDQPAHSAWKPNGRADGDAGRDLSVTAVDHPTRFAREGGGAGDAKKATDFMCANLPAKK